jgi:hypothetical protein
VVTLAGRATAGLDDLLPLAESSGSYAGGEDSTMMLLGVAAAGARGADRRGE